MMNRRGLLRRIGGGLSLSPLLGTAREALAARAAAQGEIAADVAIIGGGVGGVSAALAALRNGLSVVLTEPTDWLGGQLTSQAVPPDEHPWIEQFGSSVSYRAFREGVRGYYKTHYPLTGEALADPFLNPGGGVSRLCHEPRVALAVLTALLAPYASTGRLVVLLDHEPTRVEMDGDRARAVVVRNRRTGADVTLSAPYFVDATELGDLSPLAGMEHVIGAEGRDETGEPHALEKADPGVQQAFTSCFAVEYRDGEDHTIDRPAEYDFWRDYAPELSPPWSGKMLDLHYSQPVTLKPFTPGFDPTGEGKGLWVYRRIVDPRVFRPGSYPGGNGVTLVNWPQNDYLLGPLVGEGVTPEIAAAHIQRAKQQSLSLLYWLQTECPRPDGGAGWKGLKLRPDLVGTDDGLAKAPYIRESRRIKAEFTILEQHVGLEARRAAMGTQDVTAETFPDRVGVGSYRIDLHPATGGKNYVDISSLPFQVPLGALIPVRVENILPVCKNIGTTHVTNGCYRLHPVEWVIGEAVGALVAQCLETKETPRATRADAKRTAALQARLKAQGVDVDWPKVTAR